MDATLTHTLTQGAGPVLSGEYLTLRLGTEEYAIDIRQVQEIRSYEMPTKMVHSPSFVKGVINLRGVIVPIVDLRLKLQLPTVAYNDATVVVILNILGSTMGAVVDGVSDVVNIERESVKPAPQFDRAIESPFIVGLVTLHERMLIVMNIETLMGHSGLAVLPKMM